MSKTSILTAALSIAVALFALPSRADTSTAATEDFSSEAPSRARMNAISLEWAGLPNLPASGRYSPLQDHGTYAGVGMRYSRTLLRGRVASSPQIEQSLAAEAAL